jgi:hypothetical protein
MKFAKYVIETARSFLENFARHISIAVGIATPVRSQQTVVIPILLLRQSVDEATRAARKRHTL